MADDLSLRSQSIAEWAFRYVSTARGRKPVIVFDTATFWKEIAEGCLLYALMVRINPKTRKRRQVEMPETLQGNFLNDCQNMGVQTSHLKAAHFTSTDAKDRTLVISTFELLAKQAYVRNQEPLPWHMERISQFSSTKRRKDREEKVKEGRRISWDSSSRVDTEFQKAATTLSDMEISKLGENLYQCQSRGKDINSLFYAYERYDDIWILSEKATWINSEDSKPSSAPKWSSMASYFVISGMQNNSETGSDKKTPLDTGDEDGTEGKKKLQLEASMKTMNKFKAFSVFIGLMGTEENKSGRRLILYGTLSMALFPIFSFLMTRLVTKQFGNLSESSSLTISGIVALFAVKVVSIAFIYFAYKIDSLEQNNRSNVENKSERNPNDSESKKDR
mmetsp:Transcript_1411/g.1995  ORF Transcript_1411/g.1995 Transcript_1411/m.1995 type:complete len:391 (+) Transcript_1411:123-1295(+)